MEVSYLMVARYAEAQPMGINIIGGGIGVFTPPSVPFRSQAIYVIAQLELYEDDVKITHVVSYRLRGPDGGQVTATEDFTIGESSIPENRIVQYANFAIAFHNLEFPTEGLYRFDLIYDGQPVKAALVRIEVDSSGSSNSAQSGEGGSG